MGVMAGQAALLAHQRPMYTILVERFVDHVVMAAPAKADSLSLYLERGGRRGFHMALVAHALGHRRMNVCMQQPGGIGSVRIMAPGTKSLADRIIHMFFHEHGLVALVAAQAELIGFAFKQ